MLKRGFRIGLVADGFSGSMGTCIISLITEIRMELTTACISGSVRGGSPVVWSSISMAWVRDVKNSWDSSSFQMPSTILCISSASMVVKSASVKR